MASATGRDGLAGSSRPVSARLALAPAVASGAISVVALLRAAVSVDFNSPADGDLFLWAVELAAALTAAAVGGWMVRRSPLSGAGWLLQIASLALALSALTTTAFTRPDSWLAFGTATGDIELWANVLGRVVLLAAVVVSVPDRLLPGRVGGGLGTAVAAALAVSITAGLLLHGQGEALRNTSIGFGNRVWVDAAADVPPWIFLALLAVHTVVLVALSRQRGGEPTLFQIVGWGLAAAALPVAFPSIAEHLPAGLVDILAALALPMIPLVSVVATLRALSWTANRLVSRTLVWGLLSIGIVIMQGVAVAVAAIAGGRVGFVAAVAASVTVAAGFHAARQRLQGAIDRLLYGVGRDPWVALADLGQRMEVALGPDDVLPELAASIATAFGAAVSVELATPTGLQEVATAGTIDERAHVHTWPLVHQGERIGALTVRAPAAAPFRPADIASLANLARQAAVAVHGVRTSVELRRSQAELVAAVEDERRRLQRDLHDGLGPTLAGVALGIRAARNQRATPDGDGDALLARLTEEVEASVEEVRRIVHDLRPAVLDQLGLVAAVRAYAERCSTKQLTVAVEVIDELPTLSAATEVAAYRIAIEAITNVVRHAHAHTCHVGFRGGDGLIVEVDDDGIGLSAEITPGVGLSSMRERSLGVGGRILLDVGPNGGSRVIASLPAEVRGA
jgi:signal transduction histidine kinase